MIDILEINKDITQLSNFKTPAVAKYYFELNEKKDISLLPSLFSFIKQNNLKYFCIGGGTNMLFAFDMYEGLIIKNNLKGWLYDTRTLQLESYASEPISEIAEVLEKDDGQFIWHRFIGLPGSIGGAVFGNAGCFGLETENNFVSCEVFNVDTNCLETIEKKAMNFSYRSSILKEKGSYILLKAYFDLSKKLEKYHSVVDNIYFRRYKQPKGNTCGSFFKNPNREQSAGTLIDQVGLKGYKIGGAYFSDLHANFLMHDGTGKFDDLLNLISLAQKKVKEKFGIKLVNEVRIVTN